MSDQNSNDEEIAGCSKDITPPKKRKLIHRQQKFRNEWLTDNDLKNWLARVPNNIYRARCIMCNVEFTAEVTVIKNHKKGSKHQAKVNLTSGVKTNALDSFVTQIPATLLKQAKLAEIKICGFLAEHNISFLTVDHLDRVLKDCFPDSIIAKNVSLKRTKATAITTNVIGKYEKENMIATLKKIKFSILVDESTDISTSKNLCIVVKYYDEINNKVASKFYELLNIFKEANTSNAQHLYSLICASFVKMNIDIKNIIGFGSDGCNTMMGAHNSVASRFRDNCPGIVIVKCICHSLHICASEACKRLPRNCEDFARNVYNFFKV